MDRTDPWFDSLYLKYASRLLETAVCELNNRAAAEDLVHDVFFILLVCRAEVETYDKPVFWLYKVLYNRIKNELRRAGRSREIPLLEEHNELAGCSGEFFRLEDALPAGLSKKERQILVWFYEEDLSCQEIGQRLHRTAHACETRLYRARNRCKDLLLQQKQKNF